MAMQYLLNNLNYEPAPRSGHRTVRVGDNLYMWAGLVNGMPIAHNTPEKRQFLSNVDVFHTDLGDWISHPTTGVPPLGVCGYGCASVGDSIYYFGGECGHGNACFHNSLHKLSTSSMHWELISPTTTQEGLPMGKSGCGMVAFNDGDDMLFIVGGMGTSPYHQPGALYKAAGEYIRCNEQHMFTLSRREWSTPNVSGQPPYPVDECTLTLVGERRAALFGGRSGTGTVSDDLLIVELSRHTVHWTKIRKPATVSLFTAGEWPNNRYSHAATCMSGPLLVIVGGNRRSQTAISDLYIYDISLLLWKKLRLPGTVTERRYHSLSAIQLSPHCVLLVIFGGLKAIESLNRLSHTVLIELIQDRTLQWAVGRTLEGAALGDKRVYQQILSNWRKNQDMTHEVQQQLQRERTRARELEQRLTREKEQLQHQVNDTESTLNQVVQQAEQARDREQQLNQQLTEQNEELTERIQQLEEELLTANIQQVQQCRIAEEREQPHWEVKREEVELTDEVLGAGAWGEVKVAKFRGLPVAAKILHSIIISEYNQRQFTREMTIAAKIRHPNLLLFIGATREGEAVILTELMPTSLRKELEKNDVPKVQIICIAKDVACALRYLHQWKPSPIIHRDISSANVLLEPLPNGWRAKVSDYGSAQFMNAIATVAPGNPAYAAPEAQYPGQHSPKMDTFSYGVLLMEICIRELPEPSLEEREAQILQIQWAAMMSLVKRCTSKKPIDRPSMRSIMELLAFITDQ